MEKLLGLMIVLVSAVVAVFVGDSLGRNVSLVLLILGSMKCSPDTVASISIHSSHCLYARDTICCDWFNW